MRCTYGLFQVIPLISVSISYSNYRNSSHEKDEDNIDTNIDDSNRDFDRFVVSNIQCVMCDLQSVNAYKIQMEYYVKK